MRKTGRTRIDYMPGAAALEALDIAAKMFPKTRPQALLDTLVIAGLSALAAQALAGAVSLGPS